MENTAVSKYEISVGADECDFNNDKRGEIRIEQSLVEASVVGNFEKISELLNSDVSVDAEEYNKILFYASKNYMTPLQLAAANGHIKCVQILIERGADVNAKDRFDVTALHMAAEKGNYFCLKALLDAGADCCLPTKYSKSGCYRAVPHLGGTTPLHLAAGNNHVDCVRELIQYGADYNAIDESGRTSLYIAAQFGYSKCVLAHLKNAVGRDILSLPGFETNDTPLHFAVFHRMVDCVCELLYLGSDVNYLNNIGYSPLHVALTYSENDTKTMEILKLLILEGYNTDINLLDSGLYTPLHYVCFNGQNRKWLRRPKMAKFLISFGANVNIKNCRGTSLLQIELKSVEEEYEVLKYIVRSMLRLPRLEELNLFSQRESHPPHVVGNRAQNPNLENDVLANYRQMFQDDMVVNGNNAIEMDIVMEMMPFWALAPLGIRPHGHNIRQHVQNAVHEQLQLRAYDAYEGNMIANDARYNLEHVDENNWDPCIIEKMLWYEQLASNPRTLRHCCRYVIRQTLGTYRLKHIRKLPIPAALQSYILLEYDE